MTMTSVVSAQQFFLPTATESSIRELEHARSIQHDELAVPDLNPGDIVLVHTQTNTLILEAVDPRLSLVNVWRVNPDKDMAGRRLYQGGFIGPVYVLPRLLAGSVLCFATAADPMEIGLTTMLVSLELIRTDGL